MLSRSNLPHLLANAAAFATMNVVLPAPIFYGLGIALNLYQAYTNDRNDDVSRDVKFLNFFSAGVCTTALILNTYLSPILSIASLVISQLAYQKHLLNAVRENMGYSSPQNF
jgi:ABC-type arginine transport system permease subunit